MNHPSGNTPTLSQEQENKFFLERLVRELNAALNFKDIDKNQRELYEEFEQSAKRYFNTLLKFQGKGVEVLCRTGSRNEAASLQIFATPEIENAETRGGISAAVSPEKTYLPDGMSLSTTSIMCGLDTPAMTALMKYVAAARDMKEIKDILDEAKKHENVGYGMGIYLLRVSLGKRVIKIVLMAMIDDEKRDMIAVHRGVIRNYEESPHEFYVVPFKGNNIAVLKDLVDFMFREKMGSTWKIEEITAPTKLQLNKALTESPNNPG